MVAALSLGMSRRTSFVAASVIALAALPARAWAGPPAQPESQTLGADAQPGRRDATVDADADADASRVSVMALYAPWATVAGFASDPPVSESKGGMALGLAATYLLHSRYFQMGPSLELLHFVDRSVRPRGEQFRAALQLDALLPIGASAEMSLGGSLGYQHLWFTESHDEDGDSRHGNGLVFGPRLGAAVHVARAMELVADTRWSWGLAGVDGGPGGFTVATAELAMGAGARLSL